MAASPSAEKLTRMDNKPNFSREVKLQWAGSLDKEISPGRGGAFFLTSLFIELIEDYAFVLRTRRSTARAHLTILISPLAITFADLAKRSVLDISGRKTSGFLQC